MELIFVWLKYGDSSHQIRKAKISPKLLKVKQTLVLNLMYSQISY